MIWRFIKPFVGPLAGVAALVALVLWALGMARDAGDTAGYARGMAVAAKHKTGWDADRVAWAAEKAEAAEASAVEQAHARAEEQRRAKAHQELVDEYEKRLQIVRADAAIADAAAGRLRERVAALISAARFTARNPGPAFGGAPADDAAGVLADVFGRCVERVQRLAAIADERGAAGAACVRAYESLTNVGEALDQPAAFR